MNRLDQQTRHAVVVGVDGSIASQRSLDVAIDHALRPGRPLHVAPSCWLSAAVDVAASRNCSWARSAPHSSRRHAAR